MFQGLDHVVLFVADLQRAKRFYSEVLGLRVVVDSPAFVGVLAGGQMLGLHPTETAGQDVGHGPIPYLLVEQIDEVIAELQKRQVQIHREPVSMPSGHRIATFHDSEGNAIGLVQKG